MYNKTIIEFIETSCLCYLPQPSASADNTDLGFDNSWYHANSLLVVFTSRMQVSLMITQVSRKWKIKLLTHDPGGYSRKFWLGVCREGSRTLILFKD